MCVVWAAECGLSGSDAVPGVPAGGGHDTTSSTFGGERERATREACVR